MKLLFDQNISFRILKKLSKYFPKASQIKVENLENATDLAIWKYAKTNDFAIITFDADFADISNLRGCPPKIIWLRIGNTTTNSIAEVLIKHKTEIDSFLNDKIYNSICCLEIA